MIACLDAAYRGDRGVAAAVVIADWAASDAIEVVTADAVAAPYRPGAFYLRELPVLLAVLAHVRARLTVLVVDGYVWLDASRSKPGLGAHLWHKMAGAFPVVGVAKTAFAEDCWSRSVLRGRSARPLYVTAAGMATCDAAAAVASMSGAQRIPDMLRLADRTARDALL